MDIPPWIRGTGAVKGPMVRGGNFMQSGDSTMFFSRANPQVWGLLLFFV
jgi:hypothetical protein